MVSAIPQVAIDKDEDLTADFKAEKISAETVSCKLWMLYYSRSVLLSSANK